MAPAVAPRPQVRRPAAPVGRQRDGNLGDALVEQRSLDDHLAGELHPGPFEPQLFEAALRQRPQAAMCVVDPGAK